MTFKTSLFVASEEQGGRRIPFFSGYSPKISVNEKLYSCKVLLSEGVDSMAPGSTGQAELETDEIVLKKGDSFYLVEDGHITASGLVL